MPGADLFGGADLFDGADSFGGAELGTVSATAPNGFFPPVQYSFLWLVLAVGILLIIVAFYVLVPLLTRARTTDEQPVDSQWMYAMQPALLREKYTALIGEVATSHARGELGATAAHQRLSLLLRRFVFESSGIRAPEMTLAELREIRVTPLSDAVEKLYPGEFSGRGDESERSVPEASEMAKRVVSTWT